MGKFSGFTELTNSNFDESTDYIAGYQSDDTSSTSNFRITGDNLATWLEGTGGLDLDNMYDSNGNQPLSGGKYTTPIPDIVDNSGGTPANYTINTITDATGGTISTTLTALTDSTGGTPASTLYLVTDSTGGSTAGTTLSACTDTTATDQSGIINTNFAVLAKQIKDLIASVNKELNDNSASIIDWSKNQIATLAKKHNDMNAGLSSNAGVGLWDES